MIIPISSNCVLDRLLGWVGLEWVFAVVIIITILMGAKPGAFLFFFKLGVWLVFTRGALGEL